MDALLTDGAPCHLDFVYGGRESFWKRRGRCPRMPRSFRSTAAAVDHIVSAPLDIVAEECPGGRRQGMRKRSKHSAAAWRRWPSSPTRPASVPGGFARKAHRTAKAGSDRPDRADRRKSIGMTPDMQADPTVKAMMEMLALMEDMLESEPYRPQKGSDVGQPV